MKISLVIILVGSMLIFGGFPALAQEEGEVTYPIVTEEDAIKNIFEELEDIYFDEELDRLMSYFSEDDYPAYDTLEENMEYTFDNNENLSLSIVITSLIVSGDSAIVRVDWEKTWNDASSSSGTNDTLRLKKIEGDWKIVDLEDDSIFVVGTGLFITYPTA